MNRREASKNETRQLILKAARRLFAQKGMEESTIRDIAREAGVSPASVMVHFKSKTALLEEALNRDIETALSELVASMPEDLELLDRLMHLAKGFFRLYDHNRKLYRALIRHTIFEPAGETPNITKVSELYLRFLSGLVEEGQGTRHYQAGSGRHRGRRRDFLFVPRRPHHAFPPAGHDGGTGGRGPRGHDRPIP